VTGTFAYDTEGWGLCFDGEVLWMTTGSHMLYRRDPETFALLGGVPVTLSGRPVPMINELACVGRHIYANVFMRDRIVRIDKRSGAVVAEIDASGLVPEGGRPSDPEAVLNGIAHDPETGTFYLTGKRWASIFEVRFRR
jgi:glutaminyl-peptide cyclotransferase